MVLIFQDSYEIFGAVIERSFLLCVEFFLDC